MKDAIIIFLALSFSVATYGLWFWVYGTQALRRGVEEPERSQPPRDYCFADWVACKVKGHEWPCNAEQGVAPTQTQLDKGSGEGFAEYAEMYCKRCGYRSPLNDRLK